MHKCPLGQGTEWGGGAEPVSSWMPTSLPRALAWSRGAGSPPRAWGHPCAGESGWGQDGFPELRGLPRLERPFPCPVLALRPPPSLALTEEPSPESEEADGLASVKLVSTVEL